MSPVRPLHSGVYPGTPCGCTHSDLNAISQLMVNDGVTYGYCGASAFAGGNALTPTTAPGTTAACFANECDGFNFADNTQYYQTANTINLPYPNSFSIEVWGKVLAGSGVDTWFVRHWGPTVGQRQFAFQQNATPAYGIKIIAYSPSVGGTLAIGSGPGAGVGTCFQMAWTYDSVTDVSAVYWNGLPSGSGVLGQTLNTTPGTPTQFYGWPDSMMQFGFYSGIALTAAQIAAHWAARN